MSGGLSTYDATYLHLAESRGIDLITADNHLLMLRKDFAWIRTIEEVVRET